MKLMLKNIPKDQQERKTNKLASLDLTNLRRKTNPRLKGSVFQSSNPVGIHLAKHSRNSRNYLETTIPLGHIKERSIKDYTHYSKLEARSNFGLNETPILLQKKNIV